MPKITSSDAKTKQEMNSGVAISDPFRKRKPMAAAAKPTPRVHDARPRLLIECPNSTNSAAACLTPIATRTALEGNFFGLSGWTSISPATAVSLPLRKLSLIFMVDPGQMAGHAWTEIAYQVRRSWPRIRHGLRPNLSEDPEAPSEDPAADVD